MTHRSKSRHSVSVTSNPNGQTEVVFRRRQQTPPTIHDRLEWTVGLWADAGQYPSWPDAVRALARNLRGLEAAGLINRRTVRHPGQPPLHGVTLTEAGHKCLAALNVPSEAGES